MNLFLNVQSIQLFSSPTMDNYITMWDSFTEWQKIIGKAVLNSDLGHWTATKLNPNSSTRLDSHAEGGQN